MTSAAGAVTTSIDRDADLTVRTVTGTVTVPDLLDAMAAYHAAGPTTLVLWDFSGAALEGLTTAEVRALADATGRYVGGRDRGKTAMVFSSTFAYGLGRLFDQLRDFRDAPVAYRSFRDKAEALVWLGGSD